MRDLRRFAEALSFGEQAHNLTPNDFRPCTLSGAVNIELGLIDAGHAWYRKAQLLGARPDSIESELRSVLARMTPERREHISAHLLRLDAVQYAWLQRPATKKTAHRG